MIVWIASYPKSGNTYLRALLTNYLFFEYYKKENKFYDLSKLKFINQFPQADQFERIFTKSIIKNNFNLFNNIQLFSEFFLKYQTEYLNSKLLYFYKTHCCNFKLKYPFTNNKVTKCAIYIVRDPRNVVLSYAEHSDVPINHAFKFLSSSWVGEIFNDKYRFKVEYIGSWSENIKSWLQSKLEFPVHVIKYEDLISKTKQTFLDILLFLNTYASIPYDQSNIDEIITNNSFDSLKNLEKNGLFSESVSNRNLFFNKGINRNFESELSVEIKKKIENVFYNEMKLFNYI